MIKKKLPFIIGLALLLFYSFTLADNAPAPILATAQNTKNDSGPLFAIQANNVELSYISGKKYRVIVRSTHIIGDVAVYIEKPTPTTFTMPPKNYASLLKTESPLFKKYAPKVAIIWEDPSHQGAFYTMTGFRLKENRRAHSQTYTYYLQGEPINEGKKKQVAKGRATIYVGNLSKLGAVYPLLQIKMY